MNSHSMFTHRKKFSTTTATVDFIHELLMEMDSGSKTCGIVVNLIKAFDCVCYLKLVEKLDIYGV